MKYSYLKTLFFIVRVKAEKSGCRAIAAKRCHQILNKGSNHCSKCVADNYPYSQVDDVPPQQELLESFQKNHFNLLSSEEQIARLIISARLKKATS